MQNLEVSIVSTKDDSPVQSEGISWRLSFKAVRVHNAHLQIGQRTGTNCPVCAEGLGGAMAAIKEVEKPVDSDEVAEGDGSDKKDDSPPSYSDWYSAGKSNYQLLG